jgi:hypothetical protein
MAQENLTVSTDLHPVGAIINLLTQEGTSVEATVGGIVPPPPAFGVGLGLVLNNRTENTSFPSGNSLGAYTNSAPDGFVFQGDPTAFSLTDPTLGELTYLGAAPAECLLEFSGQVGSAIAVLAPALYMVAISVNGDLDGLGWFDVPVFRAGGAPGTVPITPENVYQTCVSRRFVTLQPGDTIKAVGAGDTAILIVLASTLTAKL